MIGGTGERFQKIADLLFDGNISAFARALGMTPGAFNSYTKGNTMPGGVILKKLMLLHINPAWVLTGIGDMYITKTHVNAELDALEKMVPFNMPDRVKWVRLYFEKTPSEMGELCGIKTESQLEIEKGFKVIEDDYIGQIMSHFNIRRKWLITGEEPRLKSKLLEEQGTPAVQEPIYNKVPSPPPPVIEISPRAARTNTLIADVQASAGFGAIVENHREIEKLPAVHLPDAPHGLNVAFQIRGDSMHPTVRHLDYVAANKVNDMDEVKDGHTYVIIDDTDGVLCKRVYRLGADWQIVSDNPIYPPYNRSKGRILGIFRAFCRWSYDFRNYHDDVREDIRQLKADVQGLKNRK